MCQRELAAHDGRQQLLVLVGIIAARYMAMQPHAILAPAPATSILHSCTHRRRPMLMPLSAIPSAGLHMERTTKPNRLHNFSISDTFFARPQRSRQSLRASASRLQGAATAIFTRPQSSRQSYRSSASRLQGAVTAMGRWCEQAGSGWARRQGKWTCRDQIN